MMIRLVCRSTLAVLSTSSAPTVEVLSASSELRESKLSTLRRNYLSTLRRDSVTTLRHRRPWGGRLLSSSESNSQAYEAAKALFTEVSRPAAQLLRKGSKADGVFEFSDADKQQLRRLLEQLDAAQQLFDRAGSLKTADDQHALDVSKVLLRRAVGESIDNDQLLDQLRGMFSRAKQLQQDEASTSGLPESVRADSNRALALSRAGKLDEAFPVIRDAVAALQQHLFAVAGRKADDSVPGLLAVESLRLFELAGTIAAQLAQRDGHARTDVERAADYFERGLTMAQSPQAVEKFLLYLGGLYDSASLWDRSVGVYERLAQHSADAGRPDAHWHALDRLGTAQANLAQRDAAVASYARALRVADELPDRDDRNRCIVSTLVSTAQLHDQADNPAEAVALLHQALGHARTSGSYPAQHAVLTQLGRTQLSRGNAKEALLNLRMAAAIAPDLPAKAQSLAFEGEAHDELGDLDRAVETLDAALGIARDAGIADLQRLVLTNLGKVYNRKVQPAKALEYLGEAAAINEQLRDRVGLMKTFSLMVTAYRGLGKDAEARAYIKKVYELDQAIKNAAQP